jgi:hypothetical protein
MLFEEIVPQLIGPNDREIAGWIIGCWPTLILSEIDPLYGGDAYTFLLADSLVTVNAGKTVGINLELGIY